MFLFKELYFPEIYRQFSTIQQNIIFIESIARCGKGNTQENIQENIQQDIQLNIQENIQQNIQKFFFETSQTQYFAMWPMNDLIEIL